MYFAAERSIHHVRQASVRVMIRADDLAWSHSSCCVARCGDRSGAFVIEKFGSCMCPDEHPRVFVVAVVLTRVTARLPLARSLHRAGTIRRTPLVASRVMWSEVLAWMGCLFGVR